MPRQFLKLRPYFPLDNPTNITSRLNSRPLVSWSFIHLKLELFSKVGADFDLPDQERKSIKDYLREWKDKFPDGAIPEFLNL